VVAALPVVVAVVDVVIVVIW